MIPAPAGSRPDLAWRRTHGDYVRYRRVVASRDWFCIVCKQQGAVRMGDSALVRDSDHSGRICLSCELHVSLLVRA